MCCDGVMEEEILLEDEKELLLLLLLQKKIKTKTALQKKILQFFFLKI